MIILLSPVIPQEEDYLLWGSKKKDNDLRYPLWYPEESDVNSGVASDIHILFYTISITSEKAGQVQLNDNVLTVFSSEKAVLTETIFRNIEYFIKEKFYADYLVHIPKNNFPLLNNLKSCFSAQDECAASFDINSPFYKNLSSDQGDAYKIATALLCEHSSKPDLACFSIDPLVDTEADIRQKAEQLLSCQNSGESSNPGDLHVRQEQPYELVSLGGWCGPAEALRMLKVRKTALPFDYIHSSLEGINKIFDGEESVFYPWAGFTRSRYTVFPHHDLGLNETNEMFQQRFGRLWSLLESEKPIIFIRTIVNPDYRTELEQIKQFVKILKEKHQRIDDRIVLIFHDQKAGTVQLQPIDKNIMAWSAQGKVGWTVPNRHEISYSYCKIISHAMNDSNWPPQAQIKRHQLVDHQTPEIYKTLYDDMSPARPDLWINWSARVRGPFPRKELNHQAMPLLICGCPSSGASLLCSVLSAHPRIFSMSDGKDKLVSSLNAVTHADGTVNFADFYESCIKELPDKYSHWCECSPANIFHVQELLELFETDVRIINIIRDGRDVITTNINETSDHIRVTPERWLKYAAAGIECDGHPQVLTVRYEDLVQQYDKIMRKIGEFIKVDFNSELDSSKGFLHSSGYENTPLKKQANINYSNPGSWKQSPEKSLLFDFLSSPDVITSLKYYGYFKQQRFPALNRIIRRLRGRIRYVIKLVKSRV